MSTKKIELKVGVNCPKRRIKAMKAVAKLTGIEEVKLDHDKGILTVVGTVDPVCLATALRKAGFCAEITTVGPPKKPEEKPKPPEKPIITPPICHPCGPICHPCGPIGPSHVVYYDQDPGCSIL